MASLFVIQGADQGKRFELLEQPTSLGRDTTNAIRLHDSEISRRHAELRPVEGSSAFRLVDLGSANGTLVNGQTISEVILGSGDQVRLGRTVLLYSEGTSAQARDLTDRIDLLARASSDDRSAILRSIPAVEGSKILQSPSVTGDWLKTRLANLAVIYQITQAISHIGDLDELLQRVLQLVFDSVGADRAAVLIEDESGALVPKAVRWRGTADPDERMTISQTIIDHVRGRHEAVISTDAPSDARFGPAQSIVTFGIREALCVPLQGRHMALGVIYADVRAGNPLVEPARREGAGSQPEGSASGRFTQEHLTLMAAIGHQAGLAVESTRFYEAKIHAERLAAVGQTIATLSHHIKNILQGLRGGSSVIELGLESHDQQMIRRGWSILEKNQNNIYNLVMDMLSYSKDRDPALEPTDLNTIVSDVVELMHARAEELKVTLEFQPSPGPLEVVIDPDGIHRALLNLITNAVDAAEQAGDGGHVSVAVSWDEPTGVARVQVKDNGPGIAPEDLPSLFQIFTSTKGTRGTGLGLPVSQKIIREHGGTIDVRSQPSQGAVFTVELPQRRYDSCSDSRSQPLPPTPAGEE